MIPHRGARGGARSRGRRLMAGRMNRGIAPGKRLGCEFPRRSCEGATEVVVGVRMPAWNVRSTGRCHSAQRPVERTFHGGAIPWQSIYRQCSSRDLGSAPESATGATSRHRSGPHTSCLPSQPTGPCQPWAKECVASTPDCSDHARPLPPKQRLVRPSRHGRAAPSPRESHRAGCAAEVSDW